MASLEYLNNQLNEYNALINKINSVRSELMKAYQSLETAADIDMYYSVDNIGADGDNIKKQRSSILSVYNNLESVVSSVNSTITTIRQQISEEESRIKVEEQVKQQEENKHSTNDIELSKTETQNNTKKTSIKKRFNFNLWNK